MEVFRESFSTTHRAPHRAPAHMVNQRPVICPVGGTVTMQRVDQRPLYTLSVTKGFVTVPILKVCAMPFGTLGES